MSKVSVVAIALLLLAACGRGEGGVEKPRVHYLLEESVPAGRHVAPSPVVARRPAADPPPRHRTSSPEPDAVLIAVQDNDMAAEEARENAAAEQGGADKGVALNYAIAPVIGN